MITLKDIYDHYHTYGATDEQIIEAYFVDNHIEDKGVQLMTRLNERRFQFLNNKIYFNKENLLYCNVILDSNPKLTEKQRRTLFKNAIRFTFYRDLEENEIKECKEIFETGNVRGCPMYFLYYLREKTNINIKTAIEFSDSFKDTVEAIIHMRDN